MESRVDQRFEKIVEWYIKVIGVIDEIDSFDIVRKIIEENDLSEFDTNFTDDTIRG